MSVFIAWCLGAGASATALVVGAVVWLHHKGRLNKVIAAIRGE